MRIPVVCIVGPTGVGKSAVALDLALALNGEIVSCDAMQVYREVSIACDKPSHKDQVLVKHHMIDVASVEEEYDVAKYAAKANEAILSILAAGKLPIVVGGSGMYVSVLLDGIFTQEAKDETLRQELLQMAQDQGPALLHERLNACDPKAAQAIHPNDAKRIVRALEVYLSTGKLISDMQRQRQGLWGRQDVIVFGFQMERQALYAKVEARVERMFECGLADEIRALSQKSLSKTAATIIGVPQVMGYVKGLYDQDRAKYLLKRDTRHYVKRQMTWFRRDERIQWFDMGQGSPVARMIGQVQVMAANEKGIG